MVCRWQPPRARSASGPTMCLEGFNPAMEDSMSITQSIKGVLALAIRRKSIPPPDTSSASTPASSPWPSLTLPLCCFSAACNIALGALSLEPRRKSPVESRSRPAMDGGLCDPAPSPPARPLRGRPRDPGRIARRWCQGYSPKGECSSGRPASTTLWTPIEAQAPLPGPAEGRNETALQPRDENREPGAVSAHRAPPRIRRAKALATRS